MSATNDEFGYIAENLNRAVAKVSKASSNQEANDSLQRSITDLLAVINQVARRRFGLARQGDQRRSGQRVGLD